MTKGKHIPKAKPRANPLSKKPSAGSTENENDNNVIVICENTPAKVTLTVTIYGSVYNIDNLFGVWKSAQNSCRTKKVTLEGVSLDSFDSLVTRDEWVKAIIQLDATRFWDDDVSKIRLFFVTNNTTTIHLGGSKSQTSLHVCAEFVNNSEGIALALLSLWNLSRRKVLN